MKKLIIITLIATLLFSVSSCSSKTGKEESSGSKSTETAEETTDKTEKDVEIPITERTVEAAETKEITFELALGKWGKRNSDAPYLEFREDYTWISPEDDLSSSKYYTGTWEIRDGKIIAHSDQGEIEYEYITEDGVEKIASDHGWSGQRLEYNMRQDL